MSDLRQRIIANLEARAGELLAYSRIYAGTDPHGEKILADLHARTELFKATFTARASVEPLAAQEVQELVLAFEGAKDQCGTDVADALQHQGNLLSTFLVDERCEPVSAKYRFPLHPWS